MVLEALLLSIQVMIIYHLWYQASEVWCKNSFRAILTLQLTVFVLFCANENNFNSIKIFSVFGGSIPYCYTDGYRHGWKAGALTQDNVGHSGLLVVTQAALELPTILLTSKLKNTLPSSFFCYYQILNFAVHELTRYATDRLDLGAYHNSAFVKAEPQLDNSSHKVFRKSAKNFLYLAAGKPSRKVRARSG